MDEELRIVKEGQEENKIQNSENNRKYIELKLFFLNLVRYNRAN